MFSGLSSLEQLHLNVNSLTSLPAGLLSGRSALRQLNLRGNRLTALPNGFFAGLTNLSSVDLQENATNPMPIPVSLEKVGADRFKAVAPTGAPTAFALSLSVSSGGAVESGSLGVTRTSEAGPAITVDIGALPALPSTHKGYALQKDATLPRAILPAVRAETPAQVTGVGVTPGAEQLQVSWTAVSDAGGYTVQWKSGDEDYAASRQAAISSGATTSYTIAGLTAGTEYTVRVIATKQFADDGTPSDEVTGTPRAVTPGQVTGLEVTAGTNRLAASWTAVSGAGGYKVQWKSGDEDYAEARQALVSSGATTSYTITGLNAGTEYTVRVIATKEHADDGTPSDEVTGTPTATAALSGLSLSGATISPVFAADTTSYTALLAHTVSSATVTPTKNNASLTIAFLDENDAALSDADAMATGHQVNLAVGENTFRIKVSTADGTSTKTYTVTVTRDGPENVCVRTPQVRNAILAAQPNVGHCSDFTSSQLASIRYLNLIDKGISSLRSGDFKGLTSLRNIHLYVNQLHSLPVDIFEGLGALQYLSLQNNQFSTLPEGVFSGLSRLEQLSLHSNNFSSLPANLFSGLAALRVVNLNYNQLSRLPANVSSGLAALERLDLRGNGLTALPANVFSGLAALEQLHLGENSLSALPANVFSGLAGLESLNLYRNGLSSLPAGIFSGLTSLSNLTLVQNTVDPLPLSVSLQKAGNNQFKAVAPSRSHGGRRVAGSQLDCRDRCRRLQGAVEVGG